MRSPRGSRATRVVGGGAPPPEQERAPKQCISCSNVHQTRLIQWETTFITCPKRSGPLPRQWDRGGRGARTPSQGVRPGPPGVPHPPVRRRTGLRRAGGVPCDLQLLQLLDTREGRGQIVGEDELAQPRSVVDSDAKSSSFRLVPRIACTRVQARPHRTLLEEHQARGSGTQKHNKANPAAGSARQCRELIWLSDSVVNSAAPSSQSARRSDNIAC